MRNFSKAELVQALRTADDPKRQALDMLDALLQHVSDLQDDDPGDNEDGLDEALEDMEESLETVRNAYEEKI